MMISPLLLPSILFTISSLILYALPSHWSKSRAIITIYVAMLSCVTSSLTFFCVPLSVDFAWLPFALFSLSLDEISAVFFGFLNIILLLFFIYSSSTISKKESVIFLLTAASANIVLLSGNLFILLIFWGTILLLLYLLLQHTSETTAQKALLVLGITDFMMLLGVVAISKLVGSYNISDALNFLPSGKIATISLSLILVAALAKAGSLPFHNWIISAAEISSVKTMVLYPAFIDKVLGIYLLTRLLPLYSQNIWLFQPILIVTGAITLIYAVLMAIVQHDLKKLLSYHAVSQVGYMLVGIGSFNPIGVLGGIFHMFNNVMYKSGLFMGAGASELQTGTNDLDKLGSLSKKMPKTFVSMLFSSAAISGVPPFNGFVSKWLIFQGLLIASSQRSPYLPIGALIVAMIGSSLTLASFLKVIHSVFLSRTDNKYASPSADDKFSIWFPQITLAFGSLLVGLAATFYVGISLLIETTVSAVFLVLISLVVGLVLFQFKISKKIRKTEVFFGGEEYKTSYAFSGGGFYKNIEVLRFLRPLYADTSAFGEFYFSLINFLKVFINVVYYGFERIIYILQIAIAKLVYGIIFVLRVLHTGELYFYISWFLVSFAVLLWILVK